MSALTARDLRKLLDCAQQLSAQSDLATLPTFIIKLLRGCFSSDYIAHTEVPFDGRLPHAIMDPDIPAGLDIEPVFQEHVEQHPVVMHATNTGDGRALAISDFISRRELRDLGLYTELYRLLRVEDQLSIGITEPGETLIGISLSRAGWGFSAREREFLDLLRPHLLQARRNAQAADQLRRQSAHWRGMLEQMPVAVVSVDSDGQPLWMTRRAAALLQSHFPRDARAGRLPPALAQWSRRPLAEADLGRVDRPLRLNSDGVTLTCRRSTTDGETLITIDAPDATAEDAAPPAIERGARRFGLTPREAEVMRWVAAGKTNPQVATLLSISPRTVQKHLERVFEKLGVETRTAALSHLIAQGAL